MITLQFLVSTTSAANDAFFAPVRGRDYGVLARFAWIGFDPKLERVAYHRRSGRAVIAREVPILPPAPFASAAVRGAPKLARSGACAQARRRRRRGADDRSVSLCGHHRVALVVARSEAARRRATRADASRERPRMDRRRASRRRR